MILLVLDVTFAIFSQCCALPCSCCLSFVLLVCSYYEIQAPQTVNLGLNLLPARIAGLHTVFFLHIYCCSLKALVFRKIVDGYFCVWTFFWAYYYCSYLFFAVSHVLSWFSFARWLLSWVVLRFSPYCSCCILSFELTEHKALHTVLSYMSWLFYPTAMK